MGRQILIRIGIIAAISLTGGVTLPQFSTGLRAETPPAPRIRIQRVQPHTASSGPRIRIFIGDGAHGTPEAEDQPAPAAAQPTQRRNLTGQSDWFWGTISDQRAAASPRRFEGAVRHAARREAIRPSRAALRRIAQRYGTLLEGAGRTNRVSPAFLLAVTYVESRGRAAAISPAGAIGLMQLMPGTARRFNVGNPLLPAQNVRGGAAYLNILFRQFDEDPVLALAGYNAGENAVISRGRVPAFRETRAYVPKVLAAYSVARELCLTPPAGPRDSCTFSDSATN